MKYLWVPLLLLVAGSANAQLKAPLRPLGPIQASSSEPLGSFVYLHGLSNGKILVNDVAKARLLLFDANLGAPKVVQQFQPDAKVFSLISYFGDSTLYLDPASRTFLVIDPEGKINRVIAIPKPVDAQYLASESLYGTPAIDPKGRLIYRGVTPPLPTALKSKYILPAQSDSAPIVRADFDTRKVDTIARVHTTWPMVNAVTEQSNGVPLLTQTVVPMPKVDQWAMLGDGTIAIVRASDYHVDWINREGTHRSTGKMPFDWLRITEEGKQKKVDSLRDELAKGPYAQPRDVRINTIDGPVAGKQVFAVATAKSLPDYDSALSLGNAMADYAGNLWVLPRTSNDASDAGLIYDVISKKGIVVERVRLPKGRVLVGFGPADTVYLNRVDGSVRFLERARIH